MSGMEVLMVKVLGSHTKSYIGDLSKCSVDFSGMVEVMVGFVSRKDVECNRGFWRGVRLRWREW